MGSKGKCCKKGCKKCPFGYKGKKKGGETSPRLYET